MTLKISMSLFNEKWEKNDHYDKVNDKNNIEISANTNTLKFEMFLKGNYEVDFGKDKSINSLLGFHNNLYTSGFHESENMVNILKINSILINIDIISGSYVLLVSHNPQFTRSFQMSPPGIKLSKILIIFLPSNNCWHNSWHHNLVNRLEWKRAKLTRREFVNAISSERD